MRIRIALVAACLATNIHPPDLRAQADDASQLQSFMRSEAYKTLINNAFATIPPTVFQRCPTLVSNGSTVTVIKPVSFAADGLPNAGLWKQTFPVSGCGNDTALHVYFSAGADEKIKTVVGVPGSTHAELTLQRDAFFYANIGASRVAKGCKAFDTKDTKFEGFGLKDPATPDPGPGGHFRPWWETWTLVGCGHTIDVPIDFQPDQTGTTITQPPGAIER